MTITFKTFTNIKNVNKLEQNNFQKLISTMAVFVAGW